MGQLPSGSFPAAIGEGEVAKENLENYWHVCERHMLLPCCFHSHFIGQSKSHGHCNLKSGYGDTVITLISWAELPYWPLDLD